MGTWPPPRAVVTARFDARAQTYDENPMHTWLARRTVDALPLTDAQRVLDVAAGTGLAGREIAHRYRGSTLVAVDLSAPMLLAGQRVESQLHPVVGDAERLPVRTGSMDVVVCVAGAAYFPFPQLAFAEFARVLRPGGHVAVQVWEQGALLVIRALRAAAAPVGIDIPDPNARLGSTDLLRREFAGAGFDQVLVFEDVWREPLPQADIAWRGMLAGMIGGALRQLPADQLADVARRFRASLAGYLKAHAEDEQPLLIATARRPG